MIGHQQSEGVCGHGDILSHQVFVSGSVHMTFSSKNKCYCNVGTILLIFIPSIVTVPTCEKLIFLKVGTSFLKFSPYSPGTFLHPKHQEELPLENSP